MPPQLGITGTELEKRLNDGTPRIMIEPATGRRPDQMASSITLMPYMMDPGEDRILADAIFKILSNPGSIPIRSCRAARRRRWPATWAVTIHYSCGTGEQNFALKQDGNAVTGDHKGEIYNGTLQGSIHGDQLKLRSNMVVPGNGIHWTFEGSVARQLHLRHGEHGRIWSRHLDGDQGMSMLKKLLACSALVLAASGAAAQPLPAYDLLLRGGHVIDAKNHIDAVMDVAIKDGQIAKVAPGLSAADAIKTIDVRGLYVTPGLIDLHTHNYTGTGERNSYAGDLSVPPDGFTFRTGVTTVVDAGCSGWRNFEDFKDRIIDRSKTRILAMLNIVGAGMRGGNYEQNTFDMDGEATAKMARAIPV